MDIDEMFSEGI